MGNALVHPIDSKHIQRQSSKHLQIACVSMHGVQWTMEDTHSIQTVLDPVFHPNTSFIGVYDGHTLDTSLIGKYDGHDRCKATEFCAKAFHTHVARQSKPALPSELIDTFSKVDNEYRKVHLSTVSSFNSVDEEERDIIQQQMDNGCSVVTAVIEPIVNPSETASKEIAYKRKWLITIANVGNSRAILIDANGSVKTLTTDHRPTDPDESKRILTAKCRIIQDRINGDLEVSRCIGDYRFKSNLSHPPAEQAVIPTPSVFTVIVDSDQLLLLACKGVFEKLTDDSVGKLIVDACKRQTSGRKDLGIVVSELLGMYCFRLCIVFARTVFKLSYTFLFLLFFFLSLFSCYIKTNHRRKAAVTIKPLFLFLSRIMMVCTYEYWLFLFLPHIHLSK